MPRPFTCDTHGAGVPTHRRRNGFSRSGRQRYVEVCAECHPVRRSLSIRGRSECPRCASRDIIVVHSGRPGQLPFRACRECRCAWERRSKLRRGVTATPDWALGDDPYIAVQAAIDAAKEGR